MKINSTFEFMIQALHRFACNIATDCPDANCRRAAKRLAAVLKEVKMTKRWRILYHYEGPYNYPAYIAEIEAATKEEAIGEFYADSYLLNKDHAVVDEVRPVNENKN